MIWTSRAWSLSVMLLLVAGPAAGAVPRFADVTAEAGVELAISTFGAVMTDVDGDGDDDLVISCHGYGPRIFVNDGRGSFNDVTRVLPRTRGDRHGIAVIDVDNDGDRDLLIAGGGSDGTGAGRGAAAMANRLADGGGFAFELVTTAWGLDVDSRHRSRAFVPVASTNGRGLDLYLVGVDREGFPNQYLRSAQPRATRYLADPASPLRLETRSEGLEVFVDLDRDGDRDLILNDHRTLRLFLAEDGAYREVESPLRSVPRAVSVAVGDLDNDGDPDVVVGSAAQATRADQLSWRGHQMLYVVRLQKGDRGDGVSFITAGDRLDVDLISKEGLTADDPSDILLGAEGRHPPSRRFSVTTEEAAGPPPAGAGQGTRLWHEDGRWHLRWTAPEGTILRGSIRAQGIAEVVELELEREAVTRPGVDRVFINHGGELRSWPRFPRLEHASITASLAVEDLDNDGWLDIVGLRRHEAGAENGEPFLLLNRGGTFELVTTTDLSSPDDDLFAADLVAAGELDGDGRVDLLVTNGFGLKPSNMGPVKLYRNVTQGAGHFLRLDLEGRRSNRDALGAQVEVWTVGDTPRLLGYRELGAGFHRAQRSHTLHVGLGPVTGEVEVRVTWPAGATSFHRVAVDGRHRVVEPGDGEGDGDGDR